MSRPWQLQEAKNRFSEVVERALREGPQTVTRRGEEVVLVVSAQEFGQASRPRTNLVEFFRSSPLRGIDLKLRRKKSTARGVDLD